MEPDCLVSELPSEQLYDLVFVPGGLPCAQAFVKSQEFGEIFNKHNNANKLVAAICASPMALKLRNLFVIYVLSYLNMSWSFVLILSIVPKNVTISVNMG